MSTYISQMSDRINESFMGKAFVVSDFTDIMNYETAKKAIARLEKQGEIRRVLRGVYDKPKYSKLLNEELLPDPDETARAIARNFNWTIAPSGNTALNLLGLSTQVPARWEYISTGPYREYEICNNTITFSHRANKTIEGMSQKTAMVIEALKAIGRAEIDEKIINKIRNNLSSEEKKNLINEGRQTTSWIYDLIKEICRDQEA